VFVVRRGRGAYTYTYVTNKKGGVGNNAWATETMKFSQTEVRT